MPDLQPFQSAMHTPDFWQNEFAAINASIEPYVGLRAEQLTPEVNLELHQVTIQGIARALQLVSDLALENRPEPPKRLGRPARVEQEPPQTPHRNGSAREISVSANDGRVELMNRKLSADEARELGARLIEAADMLQSPDGKRADEG
jgi:hypothetical protein